MSLPVRSRTLSAFVTGAGVMLAGWAIVAFGSGVDDDAVERIYRETLLGELRTDEIRLRELVDSVEAERAAAARWVTWIEGRRDGPGRHLMTVLRDSMEPATFRPQAHVVREMDALGRWSVIPDPAVREGLFQYYSDARAWNLIAQDELRIIELGLADRTEPEEWRWLMYHVPDSAVSVNWQETAPRLWDSGLLAHLRLLERGHARRRAALDDLLTANLSLQDRVRPWVRGE